MLFSSAACKRGAGSLSLLLCASMSVSLVLPLSLDGQSPPAVISTIVVEGNEFTLDNIILRELTHPLGQPFDSVAAAHDRNRLYNLGIFQMVEIFPRGNDNSGTDLVIAVRETIRLLPIPLAYPLEGQGWSYGGGINMINFQGRNQRITLTATWGAEKTYNMLFFDPWKWGQRISMSAWLTRQYTGHAVYDYRARIDQLELGLGKFSARRTVAVRAAASLGKWTISDPPDTAISTDVDRFFRLRTEIDIRTMDIWRDPTNGFRLRFQFTPLLALDAETSSFINVRFNSGLYRRLWDGPKPLVAAWGVAVSLNTGELPYYRQHFLGGRWVRGYDSDPAKVPKELRERMISNSLVLTGLELRKTVIPRRLRTISEFGLLALVFIDAAWGFGQDKSLAQAQPLVGFGVGLRAFIPFLDVVRLDLGFNTFGGDPKLQLQLGHKY